MNKGTKRGALAWIACAALLALPGAAWARDLQGRIGLGYNSQFANATSNFAPFATPGISLKYAFTRDLAGNLIAGVATSPSVNAVAALKFYKVLFFETNMNFYMMIGGGLVAGGGNVGFDAQGGFGAEFFIPGVESLGFQVETGAGVDNVSGTVVVRTLGISFLNAGIHFYF